MTRKFIFQSNPEKPHSTTSKILSSCIRQRPRAGSTNCTKSVIAKPKIIY